MSRYIDAEPLIRFIQDARCALPVESKDFHTRDEMLLNFEQYVNLMPTSDVAEVKHGEWEYKVKYTGCYSYSVTAKCSECGWDWFSKDGVGNYEAVFGAFITNGKEQPEEAERFLLDNANSNNKLRYCPNCGAKMGV